MGQEKPTRAVVIAEDDSLIREMIGHALEDKFEILPAWDGIEAIEQYRRHAGRIAAVITDLTMPRLNGEQLVDWLRDKDPNLPVIVITAYSWSRQVNRLLSHANITLLWKPFDIGLLVELVDDFTGAQREAAACRLAE
jgi:DNA-binding NtrC family response regulator